MADKLTIYPARNGHLQEVSGRLCFVLVGVERGKRVGIAIPADGLNETFDLALNLVRAHEVGGQPDPSSGYRAVTARGAAPAKVETMDTTDGQKVLLTVRSGMPGEQNLSFSPQDARDLAAALLEEADRAEGKGQTKPTVN